MPAPPEDSKTQKVHPLSRGVFGFLIFLEQFGFCSKRLRAIAEKYVLEFQQKTLNLLDGLVLGENLVNKNCKGQMGEQ